MKNKVINKINILYHVHQVYLSLLDAPTRQTFNVINVSHIATHVCLHWIYYQETRQLYPLATDFIKSSERKPSNLKYTPPPTSSSTHGLAKCSIITMSGDGYTPIKKVGVRTMDTYFSIRLHERRKQRNENKLNSNYFSGIQFAWHWQISGKNG